MTGRERQQLRTLIDKRRRQLVDDGQPRCAGCGCLHDERSSGCNTCNTRYDRRRWRATRPDYVAAERERDRERKRRRSRVKSRPAGTLETVTSLSSPAGRRPPAAVLSVSAGNRQSREESRG